jgi:hypothetical protein
MTPGPERPSVTYCPSFRTFAPSGLSFEGAFFREGGGV